MAELNNSEKLISLIDEYLEYILLFRAQASDTNSSDFLRKKNQELLGKFEAIDLSKQPEKKEQVQECIKELKVNQELLEPHIEYPKLRL